MHNAYSFYLKSMLCVALLSSSLACQPDFLEISPKGALGEEVMGFKKGLEGLLIGAYSPLNGQGAWFGGFGNWVHGSIAGGDANKGSDAGDQSDVNALQRFETLPNGFASSEKWRICYEGVARTNALIRVAKNSTDPSVTEEDRKRILAEARFLRGLYYFELKRTYNNIPYVTEEMSPGEAVKVKNDIDIYPFIEADLQYAVDNLPSVQTAAGRANKWAAATYLAKVLLYQQRFESAKILFTDIINNGTTAKGEKYDLLPHFADAFKPENDNSCESVFAVQTAVNTGSTNNANHENVLNFPYNTGTDGPAGCCGFFQPSFELVNSFRVDANGLPLPGTSYNLADNAVVTDYGLLSTQPFTPDAGPLDPRLDHSVGRRGIPYLDWAVHPGYNWIRSQYYGGPYSPKKMVFYKASQNTFSDGSSWTRGWSAINQPLIRFSDVLLMAAECEIETGDLEKARSYVNRVRARAANPDSWVKKMGTNENAANYSIGLYTQAWPDVATARTAVRFERKLELAGEGHRFFDLVRWGIAAEVLNNYLAYEGSILPVALGGGFFTIGKNEYFPIPQSQIDIHGSDILQQNPGY